MGHWKTEIPFESGSAIRKLNFCWKLYVVLENGSSIGSRSSSGNTSVFGKYKMCWKMQVTLEKRHFTENWRSIGNYMFGWKIKKIFLNMLAPLTNLNVFEQWNFHWKVEDLLDSWKFSWKMEVLIEDEYFLG